jgi:hypothetical protein
MVGKSGGKLNTFLTKWANEGPLSTLTKGKVTGFMPASLYSKVENTFLGHQIKMVEMIAQYDLAGRIMGGVGSLVDSGINRLDPNYQGHIASNFLRSFSFFLVPTRLGASVGEARANGMMAKGGEEGMSLAREILQTKDGQGAEYRNSEGKKVVSLTADEVRIVRGNAIAMQSMAIAGLESAAVKELQNALVENAGEGTRESFATVKERLGEKSSLLKDNTALGDIVLSPEIRSVLEARVVSDLVAEGKKNGRSEYDTLNDIVITFNKAGQATAEINGYRFTAETALTALEAGQALGRAELAKMRAKMSTNIEMIEYLKGAAENVASDPLQAYAAKSMLKELARVDAEILNVERMFRNADKSVDELATLRDTLQEAILSNRSLEGNVAFEKTLNRVLAEKSVMDLAKLREARGKIESETSRKIVDSKIEYIESVRKNGDLSEKLSVLLTNNAGTSERLVRAEAILKDISVNELAADDTLQKRSILAKDGSIDQEVVKQLVSEQELLINAVSNAHALNMGKDAIAEHFFDGRKFNELSVSEKLAVSFGIIKAELKMYDIEEAITQKTAELARKFGKKTVEEFSAEEQQELKLAAQETARDAAAKLDAGFAEKIDNQMILAYEALAGNIGALLAGGGKTVVYYSVLSLCRPLQAARAAFLSSWWQKRAISRS